MSLSKQNDLPYSFKTSGNRIQAWSIQSFYICSFYFEWLQRSDTIRKVIGLMNRRWGHGRWTGVSYVLLKARWRWVGERTLCYTNWHHSNRRRPQGLLPSPHTHSWWRRKNSDTSSSSPCELNSSETFFIMISPEETVIRCYYHSGFTPSKNALSQILINVTNKEWIIINVIKDINSFTDFQHIKSYKIKSKSGHNTTNLLLINIAMSTPLNASASRSLKKYINWRNQSQ